LRSVLLVCLLGFAAQAKPDHDSYLAYLRQAPEFKPLAAVGARTKDWLYMPWRYRWTIGTGEAGGRFCAAYGIRGGFIDHGRGPIDWLERWGLRFYAGHTAGKGILYLKGAHRGAPWKVVQRDCDAIRPVPLDAATLKRAREIVRRNLEKVSKSPLRWAYALDDETSWGIFVRPVCWRVQKDPAPFAAWLERYYGHPKKPQFVGPDFARAQLGQKLRDLDFSPLLDRLSYQDSVFANFIGDLVFTANAIDPETPCGIVGAQAPNAWGGYDYAKLMRKVQFLEPYDIGSAPEIARSLGAARQVTLVSTHFHSSERGMDSWLAWSRFAHGQRGMIGWVEGWFEGRRPKPWLDTFAPVLKELSRLGPKLAGAEFVSGGIALYYSHPSIQVSWILDSEAHKNTWPNRNRDAYLGTSHLVRKAWENLLNDAGLQYDFLAYDRVAREGVPEKVKVLILPACFALSDLEARRIREFAARGGKVIADFMCGLFDQHGKGRRKGALDDLFGIRHSGREQAGDFFAERFWVETDQDRGYAAKRWQEFFGTLKPELRGGFAVAERGRGGPFRKGSATYLNLSPQRYLELRGAGRAEARHRKLFLATLGIAPVVRVAGDTHLEILRWRQAGRELLFVVQNPPLRPDGSRILLRGVRRLTLRFKRPVRDLLDERTGAQLGSGARFELDFNRVEALFVSYRD